MSELRGAAARAHQRKIVLGLASVRIKDRDQNSVHDTLSLLRTASALTAKRKDKA